MSGPVPVPTGPMRLGVRAALVDGALVEGDVVVAEGRVLEVGAGGGGAGRGVAVPGFLDLHINGIVGVDFLAAGPEGYAAAGEALAATGVTGYLPAFITSPMGDYPAALAAAAEAMTAPPGAAAAAPGARVLGVHLEGPYLSPRWPGAHDPAQLREPDVAEALALVGSGPVKMMTLAPERPGGLDLVE